MEVQEQDLPIIKSWLKALAIGEVTDATLLQQSHSVSPEQGERIAKLLYDNESIDEYGRPTRNLAEQLRIDFYPKLYERQKAQKEFMNIYGPDSTLRSYYKVNRWLWIIVSAGSILLMIQMFT